MIWKQLEGYSKYEISDEGELRNKKSNKVLKGSIDQGYIMVTPYGDDGKLGKPQRLHRLVAKTFCDNPFNYEVVNHKNGNKLDNRAVNLEWTTSRMNTQEASKQNLLKPTNQQAVRRICLKTKDEVIFQSITEATSETPSIKYPEYICAVCSGKQKSAGGFRWEYLTPVVKTEKPENAIPICGFENYLITPDGIIYNIKTNKIVNPSTNGSGYLVVDLFAKETIKDVKDFTRDRSARRKKFRVHQLVAKSFLLNPDPSTHTEVNHKNKIRVDNRIENLEWCTGTMNLRHAHNKPIAQFKDNVLVNIYESLTEASNLNGFESKNISSYIIKKLKYRDCAWIYLCDLMEESFLKNINTCVFSALEKANHQREELIKVVQHLYIQKLTS